MDSFYSFSYWIYHCKFWFILVNVWCCIFLHCVFNFSHTLLKKGATVIEAVMFLVSMLLNIVMVLVFIAGIIFMLAMILTFVEQKLRQLPERRTFPLSTKWAVTLLLIFGISCTYLMANVVY